MKVDKESMFVPFTNPKSAQAWCAERSLQGATLGFVPTMGALHEGHAALVEQSVAENDFTCVSIFVNPLQFGETSDFEHYPRSWESDCKRLIASGCDMAFTGTLEQFFPGQLDGPGSLPPDDLCDPGPCALGLEGAFREGHFEGVATIVKRLFEIARPTRAYFGQKDFQQTLVVEHVAKLLGYPKIVVCPTSREATGLARSSRNERLSSSERREALVLSRALEAARAAWQAGERDCARLEECMHSVFGGSQVTVEYATVRDPANWTADAPQGPLSNAVALVAARVGPVRLIDNMLLTDTSS